MDCISTSKVIKYFRATAIFRRWLPSRSLRVEMSVPLAGAGLWLTRAARFKDFSTNLDAHVEVFRRQKGC